MAASIALVRPYSGMASRPRVSTAVEYGGTSFWVEYPSGVIDLTRSHRLTEEHPSPPPLMSGQVEIAVKGDRTIRIDTNITAMVVVDMQKSVYARNGGQLLICCGQLLPSPGTKGSSHWSDLRGPPYGCHSCSSVLGDKDYLAVRGFRNFLLSEVFTHLVLGTGALQNMNSILSPQLLCVDLGRAAEEVSALSFQINLEGFLCEMN